MARSACFRSSRSRALRAPPSPRLRCPPYPRRDDRGDFVTIKRKVERKDGTQRQGPIVKDSQNNNWDGKLIANGSVVNVKAVPFEWTYAGKSGISADLAAVQVVDFIEYTSGADNDFDVVEGGYVTETSEEDIPFAS